ncbi:MAG TPA: hypothetical protein PKA33_12495 [Amaricoccus sp.]|uniref:hypothetical protein n=1 Tax=Amaricoccus sp. TaxID=1872485 RepID=UPI002BD9FE47|nr:hypothetical protein [Amaricoccus sp.]HMQ94017.1 hypothetical protein [Amaricoccus sp.]HMR53238.1 hypothetical protein [Amaricoccus sp.]HMR61122.1 hypothetical protein [Amaricoccus sp.]HMU00171.1 hypothetical protein [Amaricoccus sp.]
MTDTASLDAAAAAMRGAMLQTVRPSATWGRVLASGVLGALIAVWRLMGAGMSLLLFGIFIGIQRIAEGVAIARMAWSVRRETPAAA